jgi:kinesin family protein C1
MENLNLDDYPLKSDDTNREQAISSMVKSPSTPERPHKPYISTGGCNLRVNSDESSLVLYQTPGGSLVAPKTPTSLIPVRRKPEAVVSTPTPTPCKTPRNSSQKALYLTKGSNVTNFTAWDFDSRMNNFEMMYKDMQSKWADTTIERSGLEETVTLCKGRSKFVPSPWDFKLSHDFCGVDSLIVVVELEALQVKLSASNESLQGELDTAKKRTDSLQERLTSADAALHDQVRSHRLEVDDTKRDHRNEIDQLRRDNTDEIDRLLRVHRDEVRELERRATVDVEDRIRELERRNDAKLGMYFLIFIPQPYSHRKNWP